MSSVRTRSSSSAEHRIIFSLPYIPRFYIRKKKKKRKDISCTPSVPLQTVQSSPRKRRTTFGARPACSSNRRSRSVISKASLQKHLFDEEKRRGMISTTTNRRYQYCFRVNAGHVDLLTSTNCRHIVIRSARKIRLTF